MTETTSVEVSALDAHGNDHGDGCSICERQVLRGRKAIEADGGVMAAARAIGAITASFHTHTYAPAGMRRVADWQVVEETWEALLVCSCGFMEWRRAPSVAR